MAPCEGSRTPWGRADRVSEIAPGVWFVGTPGHGGLKLDRKRNAAIPVGARRAGGWYEEDVEYYIPLAVHADIREGLDEQRIVVGLAHYCENALYALVAAGVLRLNDEARLILIEHEEERAKIARAKAERIPLRCSALSVGDGRVHVLFRVPDEQECVGYYMDVGTYHAMPVLVPATPDDYKQHGSLEPAPADFVWSRC